MSESDPNVEPTAEPEDAEIAKLAVADTAGNKLVPLSALMDERKLVKDLKKRVGELEPVAARVEETNQRMDQLAPYTNALANNPKLKAQVLQMVHGTAPTRTADQPEDDPEAEAFAEMMNLYNSDQSTLDVARARRVMELFDKRNGRQMTEAIRPLAGVTLSGKAQENLRAVLAMEDTDGVPLVTRESVEAVAKQLPDSLKASDGVRELILRMAIGEDKLNNRTPKAAESPMFLESAGGARRRTTIDPNLQRMAAKVGLTTEDMDKTAERVGAANGRGVRLE